MAKHKKKKRRNRRSKARFSTARERHVRAFIVQEGGDAVQERALVAAMPARDRYHTSHWLEEGVERIERAAGCTAMEAIDLLERLQRWAHRTGRLPHHDAAVQVANLELLRRTRGAEPRTVELPAPARPGDLTPLQIRVVVTQWEAFAYAAGLSDDDEPEYDRMARFCAATMLIAHLAETDGVPARVDRLDSAAFALDLEVRERDDFHAPRGLAMHVLEWSADIYARLGERGFLHAPVARRLAEELRALATAYAGSSHAA